MINLRRMKAPMLLGLVAAGMFLLSGGTASLAVGGLINPGFESGALDGNPLSWTVQRRADVVRVVDAEGPGEFSTYTDMGNVTVTPYKGNLMLRLGTPQRLAQNQNKGDNTVSQTFSSLKPNLKLAFRAFSWENRGQDLVKIDLKQGNTSVGDLPGPLQVKKSDGTVIGTCMDIPCQFSIDTGDQGQFLDSGWVVMEIVNLPTDGSNLTLSYQVSTTKDSSKPTWAYFDNFNTPPVAKFSSAPEDPQEGDAVQFLDLSYDPDPGDTIVSWLWNINGETFDGQNPYYVFPDQGDNTVSLTVTDSVGDSTTVTDGSNATDGDPVPTAFVTNSSPLVNALNTEAVAGDQVTLTGRLLDAGFQDTHTAQFSVAGSPVTTVEEENDPMISSGIATAPYAANSSTNGTLTVTDSDGASGSDGFAITTVPNTPASRANREPNNAAAGAPVLTSDGQYVSWIQQEGDIDVYEVRLPGGAALKPGTELLATLSDQPADFDVAILAKPPTGASTGFSRVGFSRVGFSRVGFSRVDSSMIGFSRVGFSRVGFSRVGFSRVGLQTFNASGVGWADIGFSRVGFSRVGFSRVGSEITPVDVNLVELGLESVGGTDLQVADFSANRGLDDETAWAVPSLAGTTFYVAVFGSNGEHSLSNYTLSLEAIEPPDLEFDLGAVCDGTPLVTAGQTSTTTVLHDYDDPNTVENDAAETVILTQEQRMRATYGMDAAAWAAYVAQLAPLAQHAGVKADIVSLPSTIYDDWDLHPCSIDAANSVATQIKSILSTPAWAGVTNVVIAGSDNIVPFRRVVDDTVIGNEQDYILDSQQKPGSPLFASVLQGYMLTDDYYADSVANGWQGGELYIPDKAIGRLVETPAEITGAAQAFLASNGVLNPTTGFVAGYDFFQDGAEVIGDNLDAGLSGPVDRMINENWTADDLRCRFLGLGVNPACATRDVSSPNAHFAHYAGLSASGFAVNDFSDHLGAAEVAAAGGATPKLAGTVVFSMGCHAGFNAPDETSEAPDPSTGIDPAMDFAQAMAQQRAVWVASTGYGIGDDQGIGGTEKLMGVFAEKLLDGGTAGQALIDAKEQYLSELATMTVYDVKSSIQSTLYGLPMYQVVPTSAITLQPNAIEENIVGNLNLTTTDTASSTPVVATSHAVESVTTADGTYYTVDGDSQATAGRTVQPKLNFNPDERHAYSTAPPPVHGVLIQGGAYVDQPNNPVFARPTLEWETVDGELQECQTGFSPSENVRLNSLETADGLLQTVAVVAGQFECTSGAASTVTGTERLFSSMTLELRRCDSTDLTPPAINDVQLRSIDEATGTVKASIDVSDANGIKRLVVLVIGDGAVIPFELPLPGLPTSGVFDMTLPAVGPGDDVIIQAEDANCNTSMDTAKSAGRNLIKIDAGPDQVAGPSGTVSLTTKVYDFVNLAEPVWYVWEFADGSFEDGVLAPESLRTVPVTIDLDGNATFTVLHALGGAKTPLTGTVEVHNSVGGIGVDDLRILSDPVGDSPTPASDLIGSGSSNTSAAITLAITTNGPVVDGVHYRIALDIGQKKGSSYKQPPDGLEDKSLQWNNGAVSGLPSATAVVVGSELRITFNIADLGLTPGQRFQWRVETQSGVPGTPGAGQLDNMPNTGWLSHTIQ